MEEPTHLQLRLLLLLRLARLGLGARNSATSEWRLERDDEHENQQAGAQVEGGAVRPTFANCKPPGRRLLAAKRIPGSSTLLLLLPLAAYGRWRETSPDNHLSWRQFFGHFQLDAQLFLSRFFTLPRENCGNFCLAWNST